MPGVAAYDLRKPDIGTADEDAADEALWLFASRRIALVANRVDGLHRELRLDGLRGGLAEGLCALRRVDAGDANAMALTSRIEQVEGIAVENGDCVPLQEDAALGEGCKGRQRGQGDQERCARPAEHYWPRFLVALVLARRRVIRAQGRVEQVDEQGMPVLDLGYRGWQLGEDGVDGVYAAGGCGGSEAVCNGVERSL